jgi:hypothetical protein
MNWIRLAQNNISCGTKKPSGSITAENRSFLCSGDDLFGRYPFRILDVLPVIPTEVTRSVAHSVHENARVAS